MKKFLVTFFSFLFCSSVFAGPIKEIVFFGDSLSDDGNLQQVLKIIPKSPPYYKGRFSNGLTWAEHVGKYYYDRSYIDYSNYAYGGATAILHDPRTDPFIAPIVLEAELDGYFMRSPFSDKSKVLYGIWIGANDYLYETAPDINKLTENVVTKTIWSITTLMNKGGQNFIVLNLPDLSQTPYAKNHNNTERLAAISLMHNKKLNEAVNNLKIKYPNLKIVYLDIYSIFGDLLTNPDKYNQKYGMHVTDTTNACWLGTVLGFYNPIIDQALLTSELEAALGGKNEILGKRFEPKTMSKIISNSPTLASAYTLGKRYDQGLEPCNNADEHLFWDDLHPTAVVHQVLGRIVVEELESQNLM